MNFTRRNLTYFTGSLFGTLVLIAALVLATVGPVSAWPSPDAEGKGGACTGVGYERDSITWTITNNESNYPDAPGYIENVKVVADGQFNTTFGAPTFTPNPVPNTGDSQATGVTDISLLPNLGGNITLTYDFVWRNAAGQKQDGYYGKQVKVHVDICTVETTTTTEQETTTTSSTIPETTTTSSTIPETTTTSSTVPETTTSTVPETTTSTVPETSTTAPKSSTTVPEVGTIPPVVVYAPVAPKYTG